MSKFFIDRPIVAMVIAILTVIVGAITIVTSTIELGHTMGLRVVAECIEDQPTLDLLRDLGCDVGQGYLISRPLPADRLFPGGNSPDITVSEQAS